MGQTLLALIDLQKTDACSPTMLLLSIQRWQGNLQEWLEAEGNLEPQSGARGGQG